MKSYKMKAGDRFRCPACGANKQHLKSRGVDDFYCNCCLAEVRLKRSEDGRRAVVTAKEAEEKHYRKDVG